MIKVNDRVLVDSKFECKVISIIHDDGITYYECQPIWEDKLFTRFVTAEKIQVIE